MWEYDSLTGDTQHQAIQRIVNKRGVFTSALSGNSCSLNRAWASAVCRLPSAVCCLPWCGKDIACIRPGLIRSDRCAGVGGSDDGIRGRTYALPGFRFQVGAYSVWHLA